MATAIASFVVLLLIVTAMSVGVLMGRKPISGSCGGVGAALGEKDYVCEICGGNPAKCDSQQERTASGAENLAYNAVESKNVVCQTSDV